MGDAQSTQKMATEDILNFLEEEVKKWSGSIKNLRESWKKKESWVPEVLRQQIEETETRWINIKSIAAMSEGNDGRIKYPANAVQLPRCCQEVQRRTEAEINQLKRNNDTLLRNNQKTEMELKELKETATTQKNKDQHAPSKPAVEGNERSGITALKQSQQVTDDKECQTEEGIEETLKKANDELEEKYRSEISRNEKLTKENHRLTECNKGLEKEKSEMLARNKSASEQTAKGETECQKQHNEEPLKEQSQQVKTYHGKQTGRDNPIESLKKQYQQMGKDKLKVLEQREILKAQNDSLQTYANQLKEEKDELLLRLSKFAGDKLVDNNPAITDLSDPNRPTKLGEFYSEIYDNEWTNAFEALVDGDYDEITAIETLRLTLLNVIQFCEGKADLLLQKASDAVNLLFEEYRQSVMEIRTPSHLTMPKRQARDVAQFLRREKSSLEDIKLQRRWEPKPNKINGDAKASSEKEQKKEQSKLNADTKLKQLRKDMASSMVPIVQKAYIEASWTNRCIEELKPYILKCLYLGWMMVVQSPPLVLHEFPTEKEIKFDKNLYKEYTASGPLVSYVVWPALLLKENGPVVCKGVAEGKKP